MNVQKTFRLKPLATRPPPFQESTLQPPPSRSFTTNFRNPTLFRDAFQRKTKPIKSVYMKLASIEF